jgi:DNA-binding response OmpR family regulator
MLAAPPPHILLVGEDRMAGGSISEYLKENSFRVTSVPDGVTMREALNSGSVDVVLLALPPVRGDAVQLARWLREESPVSIIVLSSRREEADLVMALELGADDCLTNPFSLRELLARVRALLRRRRMDVRPGKARGVRAYRFDGCELNVNTRRLVTRDQRQLAISNGEFNLLVALLGAGGCTLSRVQLLELSRLHDDEVYDRSVDVQIMRVRRKIEADYSKPRCLLTVRGAGYRVGVPVEPIY